MRIQQGVFASFITIAMGCASAANLTDTIIHTLETGPDMQMWVEQRYAQEENVKQAYSQYLPKVDAYSAIGLEQSLNSDTRDRYGTRTLTRREAGISAKQMIYDGYAARSHLESELWQTKAAAFGVQGAAQAISLEVIRTYLGVLQAHALLELSEENLSVHEQNINRVRRTHLSDVPHSSDMEQALARQADARQHYLIAREHFENMQEHFKRLVGVLPDTDSMPLPEAPTKAIPLTVGSAIATALNRHPSLREASSALAAAKADHRETKANFWPHLHLAVHANERENVEGVPGSDDSAAAMLMVDFNVFNGGADVSKRRQQARVVAHATEARNLERRAVEEQVRTAWNAMATLEEQGQYIEQKNQAMLAARDRYRHQYSTGQISMMELLDAEEEVLMANESAVSLEFRALLAQYTLLSEMGTLLESLHLPMPQAATFEPEDMSPFKFEYVSRPAE